MYLNVKFLVGCAGIIQVRMGKIKGVYNAEFAAGGVVRIVGRDRLEEFKRNWRYHHPLAEDQLAYADVQATVRHVAFYHGGDELYTLEGISGTWHECCLQGLPCGTESSG